MTVGAWIITGGTQAGVMQFVGEAVREHMLLSGNYEQKLVVIGIGVLGRIANRNAIKRGSFSIDQVEKVRCLRQARFPSKRNRLRCVRCVWMETGLQTVL